MSRIGKQPIMIPAGVTVTVEEQNVSVKGAKGELKMTAHRDIAVKVEDGVVRCEVARPSKQAAALWGTTRALIANLVKGVGEGFQKQLELHGVGYRAQLKGKDLEFALGFSHPVKILAPEGITFAVEKDKVTVSGPDKNLVGQVAANIRKFREPEPYKGKGIRYVGEHVRRKVGKVVGGTAE